eukprot:scaffold36274_cov125-Isochrysis_galbana.AAC.11
MACCLKFSSRGSPAPHPAKGPSELCFRHAAPWRYPVTGATAFRLAEARGKRERQASGARRRSPSRSRSKRAATHARKTLLRDAAYAIRIGALPLRRRRHSRQPRSALVAAAPASRPASARAARVQPSRLSTCDGGASRRAFATGASPLLLYVDRGTAMVMNPWLSPGAKKGSPLISRVSSNTQSAVAAAPSCAALGSSMHSTRRPVLASSSTTHATSVPTTGCAKRPKRSGGCPPLLSSISASPPQTPSSYKTSVLVSTRTTSQPSTTSTTRSRALTSSEMYISSVTSVWLCRQRPHACSPSLGDL